jgi:hypothetical protein
MCIYCYISIYENYHIIMDGLVSVEEQIDSYFKANESTIYLQLFILDKLGN